jgi:hypothetical protein
MEDVTDPIFHFDADPDPDPDPDPTPSITHVGKSENFLTFVQSSATPSGTVVSLVPYTIIIFNLTKIFVIGLQCLVKVVQHIAVHLLLLCNKKISDIPVPSRDVTNQTLPD